MTTINAAKVRDALIAAGLDATIHQTGGGIRTVYVGPWRREDDGDYAAAAIGPFDHDLRAEQGEVCIGRDGDDDAVYGLTVCGIVERARILVRSHRWATR